MKRRKISPQDALEKRRRANEQLTPEKLDSMIRFESSRRILIQQLQETRAYASAEEAFAAELRAWERKVVDALARAGYSVP